MYCKNCGKFLLESDKFCSNCGTPTSQIDEDTMFKTTSQEMDTSEEAAVNTVKPTPPVESIQWNIQDFPDHGVKKTEDINFDWGDTGVFKKSGAATEEIALNPTQRAAGPDENPTKPLEPPASAAHVEAMPPVVEEPVLQGKELEDEIFAEASLVETIPTGNDSNKKTTKVDKFYTFNKKNEEFQKLLDKEYEKIKMGESDPLDEQSFRDSVHAINQQSDELWPEFNPAEHVAEMARAREAFFGPDATYTIPERPDKPPVKENPIVEEIARIEENPETDEPRPSKEETVKPESEAKVEPETKAEPEAAPVIKAEQQTESEAEMPGEEPLPEADLLPDLNPKDPADFVDVPPEEQPSGPEQPSDLEPPSDSKAPVETAAEVHTSEPAKAEAADDDEVKSIRERWLKYEEDSDDDEEGEHKTGKFAKFIIGLLIFILLIQVALLGIKFIAPESAVAQFVDDKVQSVITFFQGKDNTSLDMVTDRTVAAEDKSGLIQLQIDKNKDGAITDIVYNADLGFAPGKSYQDSKIKDSIELQDNQWYTDKDGTPVYYDEQAIGTVISYESSKTLKDNQEFQTLQIGEIRVSGENLYVWVAEKISPNELQQKIIKIAVKGETMAVVKEYDA